MTSIEKLREKEYKLMKERKDLNEKAFNLESTLYSLREAIRKKEKEQEK